MKLLSKKSITFLVDSSISLINIGIGAYSIIAGYLGSKDYTVGGWGYLVILLGIIILVPALFSLRIVLVTHIFKSKPVTYCNAYMEIWLVVSAFYILLALFSYHLGIAGIIAAISLMVYIIYVRRKILFKNG